MKIVFFGTPEFAADILAYLSGFAAIQAVVCQPDKPKGRSRRPIACAVKSWSQTHLPHVPLYQPQKSADPAFISALQTLNADFFVVVAYGQILKPAVLQIPLACVNVHASLLPFYRGAAPVQRALMDGRQETGVSIMLMDAGMDTGPVLQQVKIPVGGETTYGQLEHQLCQAAMPALLACLKDLKEGKARPTAQNAELATYASKISSSDALVDWRKGAEQIVNQIRALSPKPVAHAPIVVRGTPSTLHIHRAQLVAGRQEPGAIASCEKLIIGCGTDLVELLDVQLRGKKILPADLFLRGYPCNVLYFPVI